MQIEFKKGRGPDKKQRKRRSRGFGSLRKKSKTSSRKERLGNIAKKVAAGGAVTAGVAAGVRSRKAGKTLGIKAVGALKKGFDKYAPQRVKNLSSNLGKSAGDLAESTAKESSRRLAKGAVGGALIGAGQGVGDAAKAAGRAIKNNKTVKRELNDSFRLKLSDREKALLGRLKRKGKK